MNQEYFNRSLLPKAYELQKQQKFGKDTLYQSFTCDKSFLHIVLHLYKSKFLVKTDLKRLWITIPITRRLWCDWKCTKHLPFWKLSGSNPNWQSQESIDDDWVDMRLALLLYYDFDLAVVQRFLGGEHVAEHRDPDVILPQVQGLLSTQVYNDFEGLLCYGAPAKYNEHGSREEFIAYQNYGNHKTLSKNPAAFRKAMNKEDKREYVLTFPAYLKDFIPDLWLTPNGLLQIPGKKDRVIFDSSFLLHAHSRVFNLCIDKDCEPEIVFSRAWFRYLRRIYNLRISFPNLEILLFDDDVVAAF
jgi:hypothetical protein